MQLFLLAVCAALFSVNAFAAPASLEERFSDMARNSVEKGRLLAEVASSAAPASQLRALRGLHIHLSKTELQTLQNSIPLPSHETELELAGLIADQGDPVRDLDIRPTAGSKWPFERWSELPEFSEYEFLADGSVRFRGLVLKSGDLFLIDLNDDSSDLYTAFTTNESIYGHFAFFAILERNGLRFPAAIEIHEKGLRAVPLSIFLSPRFVAYVQVYRLRDRPQGWDTKISEVVQTALREDHPYDFYSRDQVDGPLACTAVGSLILERTGIPAVTLRSKVDPRIFANFERLEYPLKEIFAPTDYMRDSRFESVGSLDNDELPRALAHQLISGAVVGDLRELSLDTRRLPAEYEFNLFAVREAQRRTPAGEALLALEGFTDADFPRGPAPLIALMPLMDQAMSKAADQLTPEIANVIALEGFHGLADLRRRLASATEDATSRIRAWFDPG